MLALTAKTEEVRERTQLQADCYGLDIPIQSLQTALLLAQDVTDAKEEQAAAELQRIGCLLLGALADKNAPMARLVVQEGGLDLILASSSWFRHHEGVSNWALWAIFQLCYEHPLNKLELVRNGSNLWDLGILLYRHRVLLLNHYVPTVAFTTQHTVSSCLI